MLQQTNCVNIIYACRFLGFARIPITCKDTELGNTIAEIFSILFIHTHIHTLSLYVCVCIDLYINIHVRMYI